MGRRNYLVEGVSGVGKTAVAEEFERRGLHVIHGDRVLAYYGDPATGAPLAAPPGLGDAETVAWGNSHWIWPVDKVKALIADTRHAVTFFCGGSRNHHHFLDLFDEVFVLDVDLATLRRRLAKRPPDEFGGRPIEQELIVRLHATKQDIPRGATIVDATAPVAQIADALLARIGSA